MKDIWDESASVPFWGSTDQLKKLSGLVEHCIEIVTESENPREMVLETWLVLDYAVRELVLNGYDLRRFSHDDFDLRYSLLPKSFEELLRFLERTISFQSSLGKEPEVADDYPPYSTMRLGFLKYMVEHHKNILDGLGDAEVEYLAKRHPELAEPFRQGRIIFSVDRESTIQRLPGGWSEVVSSLGDDWFNLAKRLNKARNKAAHSYDAADIARAFGVAGPQAVDRVRAECLELLRRLLGIALEATSQSESQEAA